MHKFPFFSYIANSPEYKTINLCYPELVDAVRHELTQLGEELLASRLITEDNLKSQFSSQAERAAQLVGSVLNMILLDTSKYHSFIRVLERRRDDHRDILTKLGKTFSELGESSEFQHNMWLSMGKSSIWDFFF